MASEQYGFVFAVVFMVVFAALIGSMPTGYQGAGETVNNVTPVDPNLLTDFTDYQNYTKDALDFTYAYYYDLGGRSWIFQQSGSEFLLSAKVLILGFLWLGGIDQVKFTLNTGVDRGQTLSLAEIEEDAPDGSAYYSLTYLTDGNSAGGLVIYWNTTLYSDPTDAWDNNVLYMVHGVGIDSTVAPNILSLLFSVLTLTLPDVPVLLNILIATPVWASLLYIIWFLIKEMIPFL